MTLDHWLALQGYTRDDLHSRSRLKHCVQIRRLAALWLRRKGYSYPGIAQVLGVHHTTVMNLISRKERERRHARYVNKRGRSDTPPPLR